MTVNLEIKINPEYANLVRPLSNNEYVELKESIKEKGLHYSIVLNPKGEILDGHHRYQICNELDIEPRYEVKAFEDLFEEQEFVIYINDKRRQLNDFAKAEDAYKLEVIEKERARLRQLSGLKNIGSSLSPNGYNDNEKGRTVKKVSGKVGISQGTYQRAKVIIENGTKEQKQKLREGKLKINQEYTKIQRDRRRQEYLEQIYNTTTTIEANDNCKLLLGDFREVANQILDNSIDLIFTDPPYEGSLLIYKDLAVLAKRVLRPGGLLVTYVGGYNLPLNLDYLKIDGLKYHWRFCVKHSGYHMKLHHYNVFIEWKLLLSYVKGEKPNEFTMKHTVSDFIQSEKPDKVLHPWQQSTVEAEDLIEKLTLENHSTVLDPFLGSGTTGVAALKLNRKFIGIETNPETFEIAKSRISKEGLGQSQK